MRIALYGRRCDAGFIDKIKLFFELISRHGCRPVIYKPFYDSICAVGYTPPVSDFFTSDADFDSSVSYFFSFGGDGTMLDAVSFVKDSNIPIAGINTGRLGFLSTIIPDQLSESIDLIFENRFFLDKRSILQVNTSNNDKKVVRYALNEVAVQKQGTALVVIHAYENNNFISTYWTDGLIVSTPTGSTAYSMSVGGPIVSPNADVFIVSPIASHNLTVRPLVIPDSGLLRLKVESRTSTFLLSVDHQSFELDISVEINIEKAPFYINLIQFEHSDFYKTIRSKLMWGMDNRN